MFDASCMGIASFFGVAALLFCALASFFGVAGLLLFALSLLFLALLFGVLVLLFGLGLLFVQGFGVDLVAVVDFSILLPS